MLTRCLYTFLLLWVSAPHVPAQSTRIEDLVFENYTPHNGLPSDYIQTITQDKYGFIWLGTPNGLIRFDGVQFRTYTHNSTSPNSLPDNDARFIAGDNTGKVWLASRKGLFYYDPAGDDFKQVSNLAGGQPIRFAACPVLDGEGHLWFYSDAGVCRLDCRSLETNLFRIAGMTDFHFFVNRLFSPVAGHIWFCSNTDLYRWDAGKSNFLKQPILNYDPALFTGGIQDIFEERPGKIWIASLFGLYSLDTITHTIEKCPYNEKDSNVTISHFSLCRSITGDSILWCSTEKKGLVLLNLRNRKFIKSFRQDNYDASSIGGSVCYHLFTGRDSILWISHINGLSKLDGHNQRIKSYRIREMADSSRMAPIRKMIPDKVHPHRYWLTTWGDGIAYYDKAAGRVIRYYSRAAGEKGRDDIHNSYDGIYDDKGRFWIGTSIGLCYYDPEQDRFVHVSGHRSELVSDTIVFRILKDDHQCLWLGTEAGLWKYDIPKNQFSRPYGLQYADSSLDNSNVYALAFDHQGRLFAGAQTGLYMLDTASAKIVALPRPVGDNKTNFNINYIWGIAPGKDKDIWVATRGGGLYQFAPEKRTYRDYKFGNGLTTEELRDVFIDSLNRVWMSSFDGVFMLDPASGHFTRYAPEDGLDNFNVSLGRWSILDNKIYSGSPGAYSIIDPYARMSLSDDFPVWITGIKALDRFIHFDPDSSAGMVLPVDYTENVLTFDFAAISYTASSRIQYAYRLDGFDKDWHFIQGQRSANYNNLAGGSYTFKLKAMNAEGASSTKIASIGVYVRPAFWETWWFRLSGLTILTSAVYWLVKRRIANIRKEAAYRQEQAEFHQKLAETEMIALRTQMNPHFIFNCMNIIDGLITDDRKEEAQGFLQKFSRLIRLVLENSQHQLVPFRQDVEALKLYIELEAIRYSHTFSYTIEADPWLTEDNYRIPPLLLQPYVENAIIHGLRHKESGEGVLFIRVKKGDDHIHIIIEDNGIGRAKANKLNLENGRTHQSIGMNVTGKRIDLLSMIYLYKVGVEITDLYPGEDTGTRVTITLPLDFAFE